MVRALDFNEVDSFNEKETSNLEMNCARVCLNKFMHSAVELNGDRRRD